MMEEERGGGRGREVITRLGIMNVLFR